MAHDFTKHPLMKLIRLRGDILKGIKNEANQAAIEPMTETVTQINAELTKRGYTPIRETIKILPL